MFSNLLFRYESDLDKFVPPLWQGTGCSRAPESSDEGTSIRFVYECRIRKKGAQRGSKIPSLRKTNGELSHRFSLGNNEQY